MARKLYVVEVRYPQSSDRYERDWFRVEAYDNVKEAKGDFEGMRYSIAGRQARIVVYERTGVLE